MNISTPISHWTDKHYFMALFLVYTAAHGGVLLIPNAIYWDDWTLYQVDRAIILDIFQQAGSMFNWAGHLHNTLLSVGPWLYRVLTFSLMFLAGVALSSILEKHRFIEKETQFLVVLLFLIFPFYWARVALIDIGYTVCYFLFFLAWAIINKYPVISLLLFLLSFNTNSLLVFYALPILDLYIRSRKAPFSVNSLISFGLIKLHFLTLPFIYFWFKLTFFSPSGILEGYNEHYSALNLLIAPARTFIDLLRLQVPLLGAILIGLLFYQSIKQIDHVGIGSVKDRKWFLYAGVLAIFFATFPYWILGHVPSFRDWSSRHQILLPLGFSLVSVGLIVVLGKQIRAVVVTLLISVSLALNAVTYIDFFKDWLKQKELIELFRASAELREADIVVFDDKTLALNGVDRTFRFYEWNGLMFQAFKDERRMGLSQAEYELLELGRLPKSYFDHGKYFRMGDFQPTKSSTGIRVAIESQPTSLSDKLSRFGLPILRLSYSKPFIIDFRP